MATPTARARAAYLLAALLLGVGSAHGCVYLMSESPDSVASLPAGTHWNYGFRGNNWDGVDGTGAAWHCLTGTQQSPLNLYNYSGTPKTQSQYKTTWSYTPLKSNGSNIQVFNNGHTIQIQWLSPLTSNVEILAKNLVTDIVNGTDPSKLKRFQLTPTQFHFHTTSEHTVDGVYYPLEMHIVHSIPQSVLPGCPASGCLSVTGVLFRLSNNIIEDNPFLDTVWKYMPEREGVVNYMAAGDVLDIEALLPKKGQRGYMQYAGSLTTPPCTEGLLWHVLRTPLTISLAQLEKYQRAVGLKECEPIDPAPTRRSSFLRRLTHDHDHTHDHAHDHAHDHLSTFQRGSYSGFTRADSLPSATVNRRLLQTNAPNASDWNCTIVSFGFTNRNVQNQDARTILAYK